MTANARPPALRSFLSLAFATLVVAAPRLAAQRTPVTIPPARLALARQVLVLARADSAFISAVTAAVEQQRSAGTRLPAIFFDSLIAAIRRTGPEMIDSTAVEYATRFSDDDLRAFVAFYQSPAGAHLAAQQPVMQQDMAAVGRRLGQRVAADVLKRLTDAGVDLTRN